VLDSLGWVLFRQGHTAEAESYLRDAYADDRGGDIARIWAKCCGNSAKPRRPNTCGRKPASRIGIISCSSRRARDCTRRRSPSPHRAAALVLLAARLHGELRVRRTALLLLCCGLLAACAATRLRPTSAAPWEERAGALQSLGSWQLDGRAAVAVGTQGWQATLNWQQRSDLAEVHLSGPFGIGALVLKRGPDGLSLNGAPPSGEVLAQLQQRWALICRSITCDSGCSEPRTRARYST